MPALPPLPNIPSPEFIGMAQVPDVNVASTVSQAKDAAKTFTNDLGIDVNALKGQGSGLLGDLQSLKDSAGGAIDSAMGQASSLGSKVQGSVSSSIGSAQSSISSGFSSVKGAFPNTGSVSDVSVGMPNLQTLDENAFGGGFGKATAPGLTPKLPDNLKVPDVGAAASQASTLGSSLAGPVSAPSAVSAISGTEIDTQILEPQEFTVPKVDTLDGGAF